MIRDANDSDIDFLLACGVKFCKLAGLTYNKEVLTKTLKLLINEGILIRSEKGCIGGLVYPLYMSGELISQEFFWWSEGGDGKKLLKAFEDKSKILGAKKVVMISLHNEYQSKIDNIYINSGYKPHESSFIKEV